VVTVGAWARTWWAALLQLSPVLFTRTRTRFLKGEGMASSLFEAQIAFADPKTIHESEKSTPASLSRRSEVGRIVRDEARAAGPGLRLARVDEIRSPYLSERHPAVPQCAQPCAQPELLPEGLLGSLAVGKPPRICRRGWD
jgi:hypothetical protein